VRPFYGLPRHAFIRLRLLGASLRHRPWPRTGIFFGLPNFRAVSPSLLRPVAKALTACLLGCFWVQPCSLALFLILGVLYCWTIATTFAGPPVRSLLRHGPPWRFPASLPASTFLMSVSRVFFPPRRPSQRRRFCGGQMLSAKIF